MIGGVDPAQALLASIGVRPIISHRIERITPAQWKAAGDIADKSDEIAKLMVGGKLDSLTVLDFDRIDYSATLQGLTQPYLPQQVEAMLHHIPPGLDGLQMSFMALAKKTYDYLYSQLPIVLRKSVAGNNNIAPPRRLVSKFESLLWALDNPLGVYNLMQNATLTSQQNDGLHAIYPSLCQHMGDESIPNAIEDERAKRPRFQLQRHTEQGVRRFLGRLPINPELGAILQAAPPKGEQGNAPEMKPASGVLSTETAPKTQQIEQRGT